MANTPIAAIYKNLKDTYEPATYPVRYPYVYDKEQAPYIYLYEVDDTRIKTALCNDRGGTCRVTVGIIEKQLDLAVDGLEAVIAHVEALAGDYSPIRIWSAQVEAVRDLTGIEEGNPVLFRREFDVLLNWENI